MERRKFTIAQARLLSGLTQEQMAQKLDMTLKTYNYKESIPRKFKLGEMLDFCSICGVDISELIFLPKNETKVEVSEP